jgi:hypothetical protein
MDGTLFSFLFDFEIDASDYRPNTPSAGPS